jgi:hypothetical protein
MTMIVVSRFIIGFASGFSSVLVPIYLGEVGEQERTGRDHAWDFAISHHCPIDSYFIFKKISLHRQDFEEPWAL